MDAGEFSVDRTLPAKIMKYDPARFLTMMLDLQYLYFKKIGDTKPVQLIGLGSESKAGHYCTQCHLVVILDARHSPPKPAEDTVTYDY